MIAYYFQELLPYLFLAKLKIQNELAYRLVAFAGVAGNIIPLTSMVFVWKAAYSGVAAVEGVSAVDMITYTIISFSIKDIFYCKVQDNILNGVRDGSVAIDLIRPFHPLGRFLAEDLASSVGSFLRRFIPLVVFSAVFFQLPLPASGVSFILFLISCCLSYALLWMLSALVGLISLWWMELGNLGMVKDAIVRLLSGSIVPLWFFPGPIQEVSAYLPFQYTFQVPLSIYIGRTAVDEAIHPMQVQLLWVLGLLTLLALIWDRGIKRVQIQGG